MRRILGWLLSTAFAVGLMFGYHTSTGGGQPQAATRIFASGPTTGPAPPAQPGPGTSRPDRAPSPGPSPVRTVTGEVAQTQWGPVQVRVSVRGGTLARVEVLQHPDGNARSVQINGYALPVLIRETMAAQSTRIDMVSGATITSDGYLRSLQSALDRGRS